MTGAKQPAIVKDLCRFIVTSISMGLNHTAVLIEGGKVITFGRNVEGQLGLGDNRNQQGLVHVKQLDHVNSTVRSYIFITTKSISILPSLHLALNSLSNSQVPIARFNRYIIRHSILNFYPVHHSTTFVQTLKCSKFILQIVQA